jgi:hypothetical protein
LPVDGTRLRGGERWVMAPEDAVVATRTLGVSAVMPSHAEARFTDPLVALALATTVPDASARFSRLVAGALPEVLCHLPAPGERVVLSGAPA